MANGANLILQGIQPAVQAARPVTNLLQGAQSANLLEQQALQNQQAQQNLQTQAIQDPLRQQLLEQRIQTGELGIQQAQAAQEQAAFNQTMQTLGQASKLIKPFIDEGDLIGAASQIGRFASLGVDPEAIQEIDQLIAEGDLDSINQQIAAIENLNRANLGDGEIIKSSQRLVNIDGQQFSEVDVARPDGSLETIRTPVGGTVARKATGLTAGEQADLDIKTTGGKETAKLAAQLKLEPSVKAAVATAVGEAKAAADIKEEGRSNQKALGVYRAAKDNLITALGGTTTGPGAGFIPALTANAQIANGAIAMMAPVLKQLFRSAGEGTFTDQDQKMLIAMVPTRDTLPEARTAQMAAIDSIINAKLGQSEQEQVTDQPAGQQSTFTSSTGIEVTVE